MLGRPSSVIAGSVRAAELRAGMLVSELSISHPSSLNQKAPLHTSYSIS